MPEFLSGLRSAYTVMDYAKGSIAHEHIHDVLARARISRLLI